MAAKTQKKTMTTQEVIAHVEQQWRYIDRLGKQLTTLSSDGESYKVLEAQRQKSQRDLLPYLKYLKRVERQAYREARYRALMNDPAYVAYVQEQMQRNLELLVELIRSL